MINKARARRSLSRDGATNDGGDRERVQQGEDDVVVGRDPRRAIGIK